MNIAMTAVYYLRNAELDAKGQVKVNVDISVERVKCMRMSRLVSLILITWIRCGIR